MSSLSETNLKKNTVVSAFSLFFQSGYSAVLGLAANLVITILLPPAAYGLYITVLSMIAVLNYFSDIGLAASLIQKKEISDDDVRTTFTVQQLLIISLIIIGFFVTPFVKDFYKLPQEGVYLYWSLLTAFFISSLKTIPSVFLERKIEFQKIVFVQIVENTIFYLSVIILAIGGFSVMSFTYSVLLRAIVGLIVIYRISFWKPQIGISVPSLKRLLSFGVPFQANSFLALFKDDLITLYLGKILGFEMLGYIGWAKKWAEAPLRIISDNITKVLFPVIARYQDDKSRVAHVIERVLYYQTAILAPVMTLAFFFMAHVVNIIPKYQKWEVAVPLFHIFVLSSFLVSLSIPFINLLNGVGKVKITFLLMAFWTALMWLLTPTLTNMYGLYGFPIAHLIVSLSTFLVIPIVKNMIPFSFTKSVYKAVIAAAVMAGILFGLTQYLPPNQLLSLIIGASIGGISYAVILTLIFQINILSEAKFFLEEKKK